MIFVLSLVRITGTIFHWQLLSMGGVVSGETVECSAAAKSLLQEVPVMYELLDILRITNMDDSEKAVYLGWKRTHKQNVSSFFLDYQRQLALAPWDTVEKIIAAGKPLMLKS